MSEGKVLRAEWPTVLQRRALSRLWPSASAGSRIVGTAGQLARLSLQHATISSQVCSACSITAIARKLPLRTKSSTCDSRTASHAESHLRRPQFLRFTPSQPASHGLLDLATGSLDPLGTVSPHLPSPGFAPFSLSSPTSHHSTSLLSPSRHGAARERQRTRIYEHSVRLKIDWPRSWNACSHGPRRNASTSSPKPSLILQRGKRSFLIALPDTFADAIDETRRLFPRLDPDALLLEREVAGFGWVRLTDSGWESEAAALAQNGDGDKPVVLRVEVDVGSGTDEEAAFLPDRKRRRCLSPSPQPSNLLPASKRKQRTSASPPHETTPSRYRLRFEGGEQMVRNQTVRSWRARAHRFTRRTTSSF